MRRFLFFGNNRPVSPGVDEKKERKRSHARHHVGIKNALAACFFRQKLTKTFFFFSFSLGFSIPPVWGSKKTGGVSFRFVFFFFVFFPCTLGISINSSPFGTSLQYSVRKTCQRKVTIMCSISSVGCRCRCRGTRFLRTTRTMRGDGCNTWYISGTCTAAA